ncbi:pentapeptide repeat-containing protein [Endozoicomonas sp. YOMI1]|uniref:pentapeptide repeat-containing protein n=1 Tax=Endozoicomonas sp. YOMI1 TaxID=2828739 RepID=UPI0021484FB7|nr:pentapeptide repeat-containing protein [Endozoicomonas sp. YOMI1]
MSSGQWARLLLINVIVGNENMVNTDWEGIELIPEGEPVMCHWDFAGLATRYPCPEKPEPAPKADDFSSMPVLLKKLRDPRAPPMNSFPLDNPCVDILAQLDDDLLGHTLKDILDQVDWQALDRMIEHSGFLPGDRSWLRQTIHDRIAWLTTRLPNSLEAGERISMAEYKAIEAAGIRGGWLPVKGRDIRGGQIGISQLLDANDQPITRMTLKLSPEAGNKLAENLALERGLHRLASRVQYTNLALNRSEHADHYRDWRSDLTSLANECEGMAEQLTRDKTRWYEKYHDTIDKTVMILQDIANKCRAALTADVPSIAKLPRIQTPLPAPKLPARVSSRTGEEVTAKIPLAEFSHGFAKLTGQSVSYLNQQQLDWADLTASPVRAVKLEAAVCEGGSILFSPPNLPDALSFENQLTITFPGHSKAVVEALFRELAGLGIDGERPGTTDLEEQWLDALADYHGCLGDMNLAVAADINTPVNTRKKAFLKQFLHLSDEDLLDWEIHCRIRAGRLVHYRRGFPHGIMANPAREFCPGHNINFYADRERDSKQVMLDSLKNEGALSSFERRTQMGMKPFGNAGHMDERLKYDTHYVFSRILENLVDKSEREFTGAMSMILKSEALGRLDGDIFPDHDQYQRPFPDLDAFARNEKIIAQSTNDYRRVIHGAKGQETRFSNPLSLLDELKKLEISSPKDQQHLLRMLKKRYSHWPDGRPLEQLFRQSWSALYYELTFKGSKVDKNIKSLIKACGEEGIQLLVEQNPQLLEGKLDSLDGLQLKGSEELRGIDFSGCSMNKTVLQSIYIKECKFNAELLSSATVKDVFFGNCSFEGERFSSSVLDNARFHPKTCLNGRVFDNTRQLARIIYQSCVNQQNEFNLEQWLKVMVKNHFLRHFYSPLDDLSRDILSQRIEEIIRAYPHQLCKIVKDLFEINFTDVDNAINFVRNNPEFYDRKVKDFRDLYFDFRNIFLREGNYPGQLGDPFEELINLGCVVSNDFSREAVLALILNVINLVMFPQSDNECLESAIKINSADEHDDCWKTISEASSDRIKNNTISSSVSDDLPLDDMIVYRANLCRFHLKRYRDYAHKFWEECSEERKLSIAKHCLTHKNVAVSHLTTVEFMKLLTKKPEEKNWLSDFSANMERHKKNQHEYNKVLEDYFGPQARDRTVIDVSILRTLSCSNGPIGTELVIGVHDFFIIQG